MVSESDEGGSEGSGEAGAREAALAASFLAAEPSAPMPVPQGPGGTAGEGAHTAPGSHESAHLLQLVAVAPPA